MKLQAGFTARQRDKSADALGEAIADEKLTRVVLLGDLNGTMNDRSLNAVTSQMRSTQGAAGSGFGFSWPASFPMARIDQIMVRMWSRSPRGRCRRRAATICRWRRV